MLFWAVGAVERPRAPGPELELELPCVEPPPYFKGDRVQRSRWTRVMGDVGCCELLNLLELQALSQRIAQRMIHQKSQIGPQSGTRSHLIQGGMVRL